MRHGKGAGVICACGQKSFQTRLATAVIWSCEDATEAWSCWYTESLKEGIQWGYFIFTAPLLTQRLEAWYFLWNSERAQSKPDPDL